MRSRAALALTAALAMAALIAFLPNLLASESKAKHPVLVGVRACAACHSGRGMGQQHCKWALSKHAKAYAVLAWPESK
ncbi:MAG: hypothetical protein IMZ55_17525, partial [Acidobacteria bacterium]|nr:hypothetical protein [Acidobacteriota bacterium]